MANITYAYSKLMQQHNLTMDDLSEDAKIGISQIKDVEKGIRMTEARGKSITPATISKIKAMDKWIVSEILDSINDTDDNDDEMPFDADDIEEDLNGDNPDNSNESPENLALGTKIDVDLRKAFESGKTSITFDELKTISPTAWKVVFDNYDDTGDNGLETSHYSLLETSENNFTLQNK
jgi:transcriptional regulator with XRE-family HTH domain